MATFACGASSSHASPAPSAYDEQEIAAAREEAAARERRPSAPGAGGIEGGLEMLSKICGEGKRIDGECAGRTGDLCAAMRSVVKACFDASAEPARCDALRDDVAEHVRRRTLGARASGAVASFCEAACELRQTGHALDEAEAKLDEICAGR